MNAAISYITANKYQLLLWFKLGNCVLVFLKGVKQAEVFEL